MLFYIQDATEGDIKIEPYQLDQIQENLLQTTGFSLDRELFFKWLRQVLAQKQTWIKPEFVQDFFRQKILQNPQLVHDIKFSGFTCIS